MRIISPYVHGIIDYLVVLFLLLSPTLFGMTGFVATMTYVLGGIHLALTILTNYQLGLIKVIPLPLHGLIELVVAILLIASPWVLGFSDNPTGVRFYTYVGLAVLAVFAFTDYRKGAVATA